MIKICYKVRISTVVGRYSTPCSFIRSFIVADNLGYYGLSRYLLSIENLKSFDILESFPVVELDSKSNSLNTPNVF